MKTISLTKGFVAKVDDADFEELSRYKWYASIGSNGNVYARRDKQVDGKKQRIYMHVVLGSPGPDEEVDHRDNDTLNNQRENLRRCTHKKNCANRRYRGGHSQYKGVSYEPAKSRWRASIQVGKRRFVIGRYADEAEAAKAYDAIAAQQHGEYACLNFPQQADRRTQ